MRDLLGDEVLDALLERSKDADGGLRLTGEGSMLADLIKAVLERAWKARFPRIWVMRNTTRRETIAGIPAMARPGKRCRPGSAR